MSALNWKTDISRPGSNWSFGRLLIPSPGNLDQAAQALLPETRHLPKYGLRDRNVNMIRLRQVRVVIDVRVVDINILVVRRRNVNPVRCLVAIQAPGTDQGNDRVSALDDAIQLSGFEVLHADFDAGGFYF